MARDYDWEAIRAEYEAGSSQSELSKKFGPSRKAIQKHIAAEGWTQDVSDVLTRMTEAKVAGVVAGCDPKKKAEALERAAEEKANVVQRHRDEWKQQEDLAKEAVANKDFELAKLAKITAETIKIRQEGERKAWGLDKDEAKVDGTFNFHWQKHD